jgi:large subunit ribosomal protein L25
VASEVKIQAEPRTEFGKGAARRIRRADKVPAVLYGHGSDPVHITLPGHDLMLALKTANALLSIELDGDSRLALPKQVQRDPIKGFIEHADLLIVRRGEKVTVEVAISLVGEAAPETFVTVDHNTIAIEAEATAIPKSIEVNIDALEVGTQIHAGDLVLPAGATLIIDPEALIVNITAATTAEELEADLAEAEAELGIEHEEAAGEGEELPAAEGEAAPAETEGAAAPAGESSEE